MKLAAAQSLVAWLWNQQPEIVYALARQVPGPLGQCFGCDIDLFTDSSSCDAGLFSSLSDPVISTDSSSLDLDTLDNPLVTCSGLDTLGLDGGLCIPTLSESDLTPVDTSAVTGGCAPTLVCSASTSVTSTDASTSNALSGVANFLTSSAGLTALAKVAASYFQAQAATSNAAAANAKSASSAQQAVLNAQTARALTGKSALPVTYIANGATGSTSAMIATTGGLLPLSGASLSALTPSSIEVFLAQYGTWILVGGAAAFLAVAATRRRTAP